MTRADQPDEETRRIAFRNAPAWAIEAGWEDPDADAGDEQEERRLRAERIRATLEDRTRRQ